MTPIFQYQRLAEPFNAAYENQPVTPSLPAISLYLWAPVTSGLMGEDRVFIYQSQAVRPVEPSLYLTPDVVTWYVQHPVKPPPKPRAVWFEPFEKTVESSLYITPDVCTWQIQHPTKPPPRTPAAWFQAATFSVDASLFASPNLDTWYFEHPTQPPQRRPHWYPPVEKTVEPTLYVTPNLDQWFFEPPTRPPAPPRSIDFPFYTTYIAEAPVINPPAPIVEVYLEVHGSDQPASVAIGSASSVYIVSSWHSKGPV